jgi:hypothetical protein
MLIWKARRWGAYAVDRPFEAAVLEALRQNRCVVALVQSDSMVLDEVRARPWPSRRAGLPSWVPLGVCGSARPGPHRPRLARHSSPPQVVDESQPTGDVLLLRESGSAPSPNKPHILFIPSDTSAFREVSRTTRPLPTSTWPPATPWSLKLA